MSIQSTIANLIIRWQFKRPGRGTLTLKALHGARKQVNALAAKYPPPPADITHTPVPADAAKGLCPAEWLSVANPERTVVYFHGGGYFFCGLTTHRPTCAYLARTAKAKVLSVDYRMAPESPFPAAVDDAVAWWKELLAQGISPATVVFAGDSAGGGLALACTLAAREQGLPLPAGLLLFSPWTDLSCSGETMRTLAKADVMFNPHSLPEAAAYYLNGQSATNPLASPLFGDLTGLPEMLVFASSHEILLADSTRLVDKAKGHGVKALLKTRSRMPHVWPTMIMLPEGRADLKTSGEFVARVTSTAAASARAA
jgi:monoterpene epsilon-lactone hydrolase